MRALVAGGAGFIGSHVCDALLARGDEVACLDNIVTGSFENIAHLDHHPRFSFLQEDVTRAPLMRVDIVLHLASPCATADYARLGIETMLANSAGTHRLLAMASDVGARFVFASTADVYGDPLEHPQSETYGGNVDPTNSRAAYAESKRFGEALTAGYARSRGANASIARIFNTYGPRMGEEAGVIPGMIAAALAGRPMPVDGDGSQTRTFCYVSDVVAGLLAIADDGDAAGCVFNIGHPREITVRNLADAVATAAGALPRIELRPASTGVPARRCPDIARMTERYGWAPQVSLEDGLEATVAYFAGEVEMLEAVA